MSERVCFSPCGNYLAIFNASGKARIWETETGILKHEFSPGSYLSTSCSSVAWIPVSISGVKNKNKKRRLSNQFSTMVLALGADSGKIFLYSVTAGEVIASLVGHTKSVTAFAVAYGTDLYSGAKNEIIQWDTKRRKTESKWSVVGQVQCMTISEDNSILLSALSSSIVCWNVQDKTQLVTLNMHKSSIVGLCIAVTASNEKYVFSAAAEDRVINAWNITNSNDESAQLRKTVAVLSVPDFPTDISCCVSSKGLLSLAAVTVTGSLHIYSHKLNGPCKKPIKPTTTVFVKPDEKSKSDMLPILAARILDTKCKIAFGKSPFVNFDNVELNTGQSQLFIVRKDPRKVTVNKEENIKKVKSTAPSNSVEYLDASAVIHASLPKAVKRKSGDQTLSENVPIETLITKMNLVSEDQLSCDASAHLLIQGLSSGDENILRSVLLTTNQSKINSTLERLPPQAVLPLLKLLTTQVQGTMWTSQVGATWLRALLRTHASQLLADDSCSTALEPLLNVVEARLNCLGPLYQLKGRLDLLLDRGSTTAKPVLDSDALLVYQDSDSPSSSNFLLEDPDENENDDENDGDEWDKLNGQEESDDEDDVEDLNMQDESDNNNSEDNDEIATPSSLVKVHKKNTKSRNRKNRSKNNDMDWS